MLMVLSAVTLARYRPRWIEERFSTERRRQAFWVGAATVLSGLALGYSDGAYNRWTNHPGFAVIGGATALLVCLPALSSRSVMRAVAGTVLLLAFVVAGLPVANSYMADRYSTVGPIYRWARDLDGSKIGIVAFAEQYPLFGPDLDNQVSYVATVGAHGSLVLATSCAQWREELSRGRYDYVVIGDNDWSLAPIRERGWTQSDSAAKPVIVTSRGAAGPQGMVFQISAGIATTAGC
jgi:hypothetical protein